ncbi:hypothetical protein BJ742DRAFT_744214 [Cladochytrium replicatum]|nr:hypothetical protein BJ742DRAFT_744214 [Cladochytrium replicatum]
MGLAHPQPFLVPTPDQDLGLNRNFGDTGPPIIRTLNDSSKNNYEDVLGEPAPNKHKRRRLAQNGKISVTVYTSEQTSPEPPAYEESLSSSSGTARSGSIAKDLLVKLEEQKKRFRQQFTVTVDCSGGASPSLRFVPGSRSSADSPSARRPRAQPENFKLLEEQPKHPHRSLAKMEKKPEPIPIKHEKGADSQNPIIKIDDEPTIKVEVKEEESEKVISDASSVIRNDREEMLASPESVHMELRWNEKEKKHGLFKWWWGAMARGLGGLQLSVYNRQRLRATIQHQLPLLLERRTEPQAGVPLVG